MRILATTLSVMLFAVAACTLSPTPSSVTGVSGLDRSIQRFYAANARERAASCNRVRMAIRAADVVSQDGDQWTLNVRYFWSDPTTAADPGNTCRGSGQRRFVVDVAGGQARVLSMSGEQR